MRQGVVNERGLVNVHYHLVEQIKQCCRAAMLESISAYGLKFLVPAGDTGVGRCLREFGEFARVEVEAIRQLVGVRLLSMWVPISARSPCP